VGHDGKQTFYEAQVRLVVGDATLTAAQDRVARNDGASLPVRARGSDIGPLLPCSLWDGNVLCGSSSQRRMSREGHSDAPKFVTPMPHVKSSNFRPLCIVTHEPSPFTMTSSVRWFNPFVTWRCAKSRSGAVVIERPLQRGEETKEVREIDHQNDSTYRARGTSACELRDAVRSKFCPSDIWWSQNGRRGVLARIDQPITRG
jgi:hypothetical protein